MALIDKGVSHFHHFALDTVDIGQMRDMLDHLARHGRWLGWGPARHGVGGNIASYVRIVEEECFVELYCDMEQLQDDHEPRRGPTTATRRTPGGRCRRARTSASIRLRWNGSARAASPLGETLPPVRPRDAGTGLLDPAHRPRAARRSFHIPPWHYVGDFLVIEYWADPERAVSFLPAGPRPAS